MDKDIPGIKAIIIENIIINVYKIYNSINIEATSNINKD